MTRIDDANDLVGPVLDLALVKELAEADNEVAELAQQLVECREAEIRWASTVADDIARLNDLRSLRRSVEREIRQLIEDREIEDQNQGS